jgi:hypothetical protein
MCSRTPTFQAESDSEQGTILHRKFVTISSAPHITANHKDCLRSSQKLKSKMEMWRKKRRSTTPIGHQAAYRAFPDTQIRTRPIMYLGFIKDADDVCFDIMNLVLLILFWSLLRTKLRANAIRATVQISVFSVRGKD